MDYRESVELDLGQVNCGMNRTWTGTVADCVVSLVLLLGQKWTGTGTVVDCVISVRLVIGQ